MTLRTDDGPIIKLWFRATGVICLGAIGIWAVVMKRERDDRRGRD